MWWYWRHLVWKHSSMFMVWLHVTGVVACIIILVYVAVSQSTTYCSVHYTLFITMPPFPPLSLLFFVFSSCLGPCSTRKRNKKIAISSIHHLDPCSPFHPLLLIPFMLFMLSPFVFLWLLCFMFPLILLVLITPLLLLVLFLCFCNHISCVLHSRCSFHSQ